MSFPPLVLKAQAPIAPGRWWRPALELIAAIALLEVALWQPPDGPYATWGRVLTLGGVLVVLGLSAARRSWTWPVKEPRTGPLRAWAEALTVTALLAAVLMAAAALLRWEHERPFWARMTQPLWEHPTWFAQKVASALVQQAMIQYFLGPVCRELFPRRAAVLLAAGIFGVLHLPSLALVAVTGVAAVAWLALYARGGRLTPLVASHIVLASLAFAELPPRLIYHLRVGAAALPDRAFYAELGRPATSALFRRLSSHAYFSAEGGTLPAFVRGLYREALGRTPAQVEEDYLVGYLRHVPRDEVVGQVLTSPEFRAREPLRETAHGAP